MLLVSFYSEKASSFVDTGSKPILLKSGKISPYSVIDGNIEKHSKSVLSRIGDLKKHVIVQFDHIPDEEEKKLLADEGMNLLDYIPENAWYASAKLSEIEKIAEKHGITYVGEVSSENKKDFAAESLGMSEIRVMFFSDTEKEDMKNVISTYGDFQEASNNVWSVQIDEGRIDDLLNEDAVQWIEKKPNLITLNDGSRSLISVSESQVAPYGVNGSGVVLAEWDFGWAEETHSGLANRTTIGDTLGCGGAGDTGSCAYVDHSTHVAGTMIGNGSTGSYWGMAPNATLISYEWPDTPTELINETNLSIADYGAVVSQNSWGYCIGQGCGSPAACSIHGDYDIWSARYDNITKGNGIDAPITVVFAAGNDGGSSHICSGGFNTTSGPGATAKNVITVGAVDDSGTMSSFSSWGPTDDGRIKPDVVADGVSITSTDVGNDYSVKSGTSMAAPAVSGAIALLVEDYRSTHNDSNMLPSTIRGLLIHTADDTNNTGPDYTTGWGIINITRGLDKIRQDVNSTEFIIESNISNSESDIYYVFVQEGQSEFKMTLTWDDYPGTPAAAKELVNDLDLIVTNSSGQRVYPWTLGFNPVANATQDQIDSINNVEQVYVSNPSSGVWTIQINGTLIPQGPQNYSLITNNDFELPIVSLGTPADNFLTSDSNVTFNCSVTDGGGLANITLYTNVYGSWTVNDTVDVTGFSNSSQWNITDISSGEYTWNCVSYDNNSNSNWGTNRSITVDSTSPSWSGNITNLTDTYNSTGISYFNITWSEALTNITVLIEGNWSGSNVNYSVTNNSNVFQYNTTLPAGDLYWISWANDSSGNLNFTNTWIFTISKEAVLINLTLDGSDGDITVETGAVVNLNSTLNVSGLNISLYRNSSFISNSTTPLGSLWNTTDFALDAYNITSIFSSNQNYTTTSETHFVVVDDTSPPNISNSSISSTPLIAGENITVFANITDNFAVNASEVWFNISNTTWSVNVMMDNTSDSYNTSYNTTSLMSSSYNVTIYANDTKGNNVNSSTNGFSIGDPSEASINILDYQDNQTNASWIQIFYNGTKTIRNQTINSTGVNLTIPQGFWDIKIVSDFNITINNVNIINNSAGNFSLDNNITESGITLPSNVLVFVDTVAIDTNFEFSNAILEVSYNNTSITNNGRINVYACHTWNLSNRMCDGSWENITENSTINSTISIAIINSTNLSAFSVGEGYSCGDGIIDSGETCNSCPADVGACAINTNTGGSGASLSSTTPKTKEVVILSPLSVTVIKEGYFVITIENTGETNLTEVFVNTDCDCEVTITPNNFSLNIGERKGVKADISGDVGNHSINFSVDSKEGASNISNTIIILLECTPGDIICVDNKLERCISGTEWIIEECEHGCSNSSCLDPPMICEAGATRCVDNNVEACREGFSWESKQFCDFGCFEGMCAEEPDYTLYYEVAGAVLVVIIFINAIYFRRKRGKRKWKTLEKRWRKKKRDWRYTYSGKSKRK